MSANKDLQKNFELAYKGKMSFNPDLNKQAQEVILSRKLNKSSHPKIFLNNAPVGLCQLAQVTLRNLVKHFPGIL